MRPIIFRGQLPSGAWVYGDLRQYPSGNVAIRSDEWGHTMTVSPDTVGQHTGMTDYNGVPIYEGDLIEALLPRTDAVAQFRWPLAAVFFHEGAFCLDYGHGRFTPLNSFAPSVQLHVVGNVYESPVSEEAWNDNAR